MASYEDEAGFELGELDEPLVEDVPEDWQEEDLVLDDDEEISGDY